MDFTEPAEIETVDARGARPLASRIPQQPASRSIGEWLRILRDGWLAVLALALLGIGAGLLATRLQPTQYESKTTLVASSNSGFLNPEFSTGLTEVTATVTRLAGSAAVLRGAGVEYVASARDPETRTRRRQQGSIDWLSRHLEAQQVPDSGIVELSGRAETQGDARALTNAGAQSLERAIAGEPGSGVTAAPARRARGAKARNPVGGAAALRNFQARDEGKISPTPTRNVLLGGNAGLILGIVAGMALGARRRRVRRPDELAAEFGVPVLGSLRTSQLATGVDPAVGAIRARLQRLAQPDEGTVFLLTGTVRPERMAEIGQALVRAFAASSRAVLVDADLPSQCASRRLNLDGLPGLADLLDAQRPGHEGLFRPEQVLVTAVDGTGEQDPAIEVLPAGEAPVDVAAALGGSALSKSLQKLRLRYEFVIVVGPGLDRPGEVIPLISAADWSVLVTPRGERARVLESAQGLADALAGRVAGALFVNRR